MGFAQLKEAGGNWNIKTASQSFSKLFNAALERPQVVSRRTEDRVYMISEEDLTELADAPNDLYGVVVSMTKVPGLSDSLQPRKPFKRRTLS